MYSNLCLGLGDNVATASGSSNTAPPVGSGFYPNPAYQVFHDQFAPFLDETEIGGDQIDFCTCAEGAGQSLRDCPARPLPQNPTLGVCVL